MSLNTQGGLTVDPEEAFTAVIRGPLNPEIVNKKCYLPENSYLKEGNVVTIPLGENEVVIHFPRHVDIIEEDNRLWFYLPNGTRVSDKSVSIPGTDGQRLEIPIASDSTSLPKGVFIDKNDGGVYVSFDVGEGTCASCSNGELDIHFRGLVCERHGGSMMTPGSCCGEYSELAGAILRDDT